MVTSKPKTIVAINVTERETLLTRAAAASLAGEDVARICAVFESYAYVSTLIDQKNLTLPRLRKMLFGDRTETSANVLGTARSGAAATEDAPPPAATTSTAPEASAEATAPQSKATPRRRGEGHPHDADPHLRTVRRESVELPHAIATPRRGGRRRSRRVVAVELPRHPGRAHGDFLNSLAEPTRANGHPVARPARCRPPTVREMQPSRASPPRHLPPPLGPAAGLIQSSQSPKNRPDFGNYRLTERTQPAEKRRFSSTARTVSVLAANERKKWTLVADNRRAKTCGTRVIGFCSRAGRLRRLAAAARFREHHRHDVQLTGKPAARHRHRMLPLTGRHT